MYKITIQDLINFYIIAVPFSLMVTTTYLAITLNGKWIIEMNRYGEYYFEVFMFLLWFVLVIFRGKHFYTNIMK